MAENDREVARLNHVLSALEVTISSGEDGRFTAYTLSEPLFCFERNSEAELQELIADTLRSYVESFYHLSAVRVEFSSTPERTVDIPVERLTPVSRVRPFVRPIPEKERQLEPA